MYNAPTIPLLSPYYGSTQLRASQRVHQLACRMAEPRKSIQRSRSFEQREKRKSKRKKRTKKKKKKKKKRESAIVVHHTARAHTGTGGLSLLLYLIIEQIRKHPNDLQRIANERDALRQRIKRLYNKIIEVPELSQNRNQIRTAILREYETNKGRFRAPFVFGV